MIKLLTNDKIYARISKASKEVALEHFGWASHIRNLEDLYYSEK